jgi:thioester reductase-like protein
MGKRRYRRKEASLEALIREHREQIARERRKTTPDLGLIHHWEREIEAILGDLSAAILHMHEHTRGLDAIIDEDPGVG